MVNTGSLVRQQLKNTFEGKLGENPKNSNDLGKILYENWDDYIEKIARAAARKIVFFVLV